MALYPSFEPPSMFEEEEGTQAEDVVAPKFNEEKERIEVNGVGQAVIGDEKDAYRFWAIKCCLTERYQYAAYSDDFGVEFGTIIRANYPRSIAESEIERTIAEALSVDPRTVAVDNFSFEWKGDSVWMTYRVESIYNTEIYEMQRGGEGVARIRVRAA